MALTRAERKLIANLTEKIERSTTQREEMITRFEAMLHETRTISGDAKSRHNDIVAAEDRMRLMCGQVTDAIRQMRFHLDQAQKDVSMSMKGVIELITRE